jgi:hypothetical protein
MMKKVVGILIVGLLIVTILSVGSSIAQPAAEKHINTLTSQIEIKIKGGWGIHAIIKNMGTTDLNNADMTLALDGRMIFPGFKDNVGTLDLKAGKTQLVIFPIRGFGTTNIELTVDTTTETSSGMVLGSIAFGVK